jgi:hypothetical protein
MDENHQTAIIGNTSVLQWKVTNIVITYIFVDATLKRYNTFQRANGVIRKVSANYVKYVMITEFNIHQQARKKI